MLNTTAFFGSGLFIIVGDDYDLPIAGRGRLRPDDDQALTAIKAACYSSESSSSRSSLSDAEFMQCPRQVY